LIILLKLQQDLKLAKSQMTSYLTASWSSDFGKLEILQQPKQNDQLQMSTQLQQIPF